MAMDRGLSKRSMAKSPRVTEMMQFGRISLLPVDEKQLKNLIRVAANNSITSGRVFHDLRKG